MSTSILARLVLLATLAALTRAADVPLPATDTWYTFDWNAIGPANPTYSVNFADPGFVTITDSFCAGDQFSLTVDGTLQGSTSAPLAYGCGTYIYSYDDALKDPRWSSGQFFVPAGTHSLKISALPGSLTSGGAAIKAKQGVCQIPLTGDFQLTTKLVPGSSADQACKQQGLELAQITSSNIALAAKVVRTCLGLLKATQNQVFIKSWNGDDYAGATMAMYVSTGGQSINIADAATHFALCQKPVGPPGWPYQEPTVQARSTDGSIAVVQPAGPACNAVQACGAVGMVPIVLSGARPDEFQAATTVAFSALGGFGKAWVGGWEQPAGNQHLALHLGAAAPGGSVNVPAYDPASPGPITLPYLCKKLAPAPPGVARRSAEVKDEL